MKTIKALSISLLIVFVCMFLNSKLKVAGLANGANTMNNKVLALSTPMIWFIICVAVLILAGIIFTIVTSINHKDKK